MNAPAVMFKKATKKTAKARIALMGPSGSGKTVTALLVATGLGTRIAVIDTENDSASKYAGAFGGLDFDVLALESFSPERYVEAIQAAEAAGYEVIVVDSLTHAWSGKDGALEQVDRAAKRSQSGNSFMAWRDVTPMHNRLVDAIVRCKCHIIATMRTKTEYVLEEVTRGGKTTKQPKRVGLAPVQRDGMEYEFDIVADITLDHDLIVTKTRCQLLDGAVVSKPGKGFGATVSAWLSDGEPAGVVYRQIVDGELTPPKPVTVVTPERPDTRPARKVESKPEPEPLRGPPQLIGKKYKGKEPVTMESLATPDQVIDYVRSLMHAQQADTESGGRFKDYWKRQVEDAKLWSHACRGITDFSVSKAERAKQLKAAVDDRNAFSDEMYLCENHGMYGDDTGLDLDIRKWRNAEKLVEYINWLRGTYNQPTQTARITCAEQCLTKLIEAEAEAAERALSKKAASQ